MADYFDRRARIEAALSESKLARDFLARRGMDVEGYLAFDSPKPGELDGMGSLIGAIRAAMAQGRRIVVYPDYDCDGISAGVTLVAGLALAGANVSIIPSPTGQGYGISEQKMRDALDLVGDDCLILTCDGGIDDADAVRFAAMRGVPVAVTDHHIENRRTSSRPWAVAVVDPCGVGSGYPLPGICGANVAYKVIRELIGGCGPEVDRLALFAGLGTVSDAMPLVGENRPLVRDAVSYARWLASVGRDGAERDLAGLPPLYIRAFAGAAALLSSVCEDKHISAADIHEDLFAFYIAPMLNSPKRMLGDMAVVFDLFCGGGDIDSDVSYITKCNERRRATVDDIFRSLMGTEQPHPWLSLVSDPNDILGLVANRLTGIGSDAPHPAVVLRPNAMGYSGSARSAMGWPMLSHAQLHGIWARGHEGAFGLRFDSLDEAVGYMCLAQRDFGEYRADMPVMTVGCDLELSSDGSDGTPLPTTAELCRFVDAVECLRPFGQGFPEPTVSVSFDADDARDCRVMGHGRNHAKVSLATIDLVSFNDTHAASLEHGLVPGRYVLRGRLSVNEWGGVRTPQLLVDGDIVDGRVR